MRLKLITPLIVSKEECERRELKYKAALRPNTNVNVVSITTGASEIKGYATSVLSDYGVLKEGQKAESEGYDAVVPDCALDPAGKALKEMLTIPVVLPLETSIHLATLLGSKFSILGVDAYGCRMLVNKIDEYGLCSKLASARPLDLTLDQTSGDIALEKTLKVSQNAIGEDGAEVIILGCTTMIGLKKRLEEKLGVPVIEPGVLAAKTAEIFVDLCLGQSKRAYPVPQ